MVDVDINLLLFICSGSKACVYDCIAEVFDSGRHLSRLHLQCEFKKLSLKLMKDR